MTKLDSVQQVMALDATLAHLEDMRVRAIESTNVSEIGRISAELGYYRKERNRMHQTLTAMEERRYEVECEERHE